MKGMKIISALLFSLVYASLFLGCASEQPAPSASAEPQKEKRHLSAPAPVAVNHRAFSQTVEQAGEHWRDLASDVAERVLKAYSDREDLLTLPLYLPVPNNRHFTVSFYHLLRTELVSRGLQVSYEKEPRSVILEYWVQIVPFDKSRLDDSKRFDNAGAKPSDSEIIVSARMSYRNRFVMHCSQVRYINEADLALYVDPQSFDPMASSSRNIRITNK